MIDGIILGLIQGIGEWIPISSESVLVLAQLYLTPGVSLHGMLSLALFLHLGTFLAALVYFREDIRRVIRTLISYKKATLEEKRLAEFLIITTVISGTVGLIFFSAIEESIVLEMTMSGRAIMAAIGALLLLGAIFEKIGKRKVEHTRGAKDIRGEDIILAGASQAFAVLPGFSRSGLTVATLLWRGFTVTEALRLSFLMSLPLVLGGNIVLNLNEFSVSTTALVGLVTAFVVGLGAVRVLFALARRLSFANFVFIFGLLTFLAGVLGFITGH